MQQKTGCVICMGLSSRPFSRSACIRERHSGHVLLLKNGFVLEMIADLPPHSLTPLCGTTHPLTCKRGETGKSMSTLSIISQLTAHCLCFSCISACARISGSKVRTGLVYCLWKRVQKLNKYITEMSTLLIWIHCVPKVCYG